MTKLGRQWILEYSACTRERLERCEDVRAAMLGAAEAMAATVVSDQFQQFEPMGVSGVVVISESHLAIHTWPEHHYAAVDFFSCDDDLDLELARDHLAEAFEAERVEHEEHERGPDTTS